MRRVDIGCDGSDVVLTIDGVSTVISWEHADVIGRAILAKARQAEEQAKALQVIADGALLLRAGALIGLSNRPDIRSEIEHAAQYDSDLTRYMPGGVRSAEHFGVPSIILGPSRRGMKA